MVPWYVYTCGTHTLAVRIYMIQKGNNMVSSYEIILHFTGQVVQHGTQPAFHQIHHDQMIVLENRTRIKSHTLQK